MPTKPETQKEEPVEPYDAFDAIDPFAAATRAFDCLKGTLAGQESAALSHHELEELVQEEGRELLRLLFQDHLDLRERWEREQIEQGGMEAVRGAERPTFNARHSSDTLCPSGLSSVAFSTSMNR